MPPGLFSIVSALSEGHKDGLRMVWAHCRFFDEKRLRTFILRLL